MTNDLRRKLSEGKTIINGWRCIPYAFAGETLASAGWYGITLDMQHGIKDYANVIVSMHAMSRFPLTPTRVVPDTLVSALSSWPKAAPCRHTTQVGSVDDTVILAVPASLRRSGIGKRMIIDGARRSEPDPALIKILVKAFEMRSALLTAQGATLESIADRIGINSSYATRLLRLSFLSPEIVRMILDGRHPPTLTAKRLRADTRLPLSWNDQLAAIS